MDEFYKSEKKGQKVLLIQHIPFGDENSDDKKAGRVFKMLLKRF